MQKDSTAVRLTLGPSGSVFVLFRDTPPPTDRVVALARNGKRICSMSEPPRKIVVHSAVYGVPGDPKRSRDVPARSRRKLDAGDDSFLVSDLAARGDPAINVVKSLVADYAIGDRRFTIKGQDNDTVQFSGNAVEITVEKALYGVLGDPKRTRDVRGRIQRLADTGVSSFQVAAMAGGNDPAFGIVKTLVLEYTIGGKRVAATGTDPETILLAAPRVPTRRGGLLRSARRLASSKLGTTASTTSSGLLEMCNVWWSTTCPRRGS